MARRRAQVVGLGLIGGSLGMALRERAWTVTGSDQDPDRSARALELGAVDAVGADPLADVTFVATPVKAVAVEVRAALEASDGLVTDVGSVKSAVLDAVGAEPRFVGGHPMAGSEREGVDGSDPNLFRGAAWVLTPTEHTDGRAFAEIRAIVSSLGAEAVSMPPEAHDRMVAVVSHVPHLTAATLMNLAGERATDHRALLRLAAGGFRDMTRIASGHPAIWPDICEENRDAIVDALDGLLAHLADVRAVVAGGERDQLTKMLEEARQGRLSLPVRAPRPTQLVELRIPVPDRPGAIAEVANTASELLVNIYDLEIAHSAEGPTGVMHVLVEAVRADALRQALDARGFVSSMRKLV